MMTFNEFLSAYNTIKNEDCIKITYPGGKTAALTDHDLKVTWIIGLLGEIRGYPCDVTAEEIATLMDIFFNYHGKSNDKAAVSD